MVGVEGSLKKELRVIHVLTHYEFFPCLGLTVGEFRVLLF
jgi:hypothetical protein